MEKESHYNLDIATGEQKEKIKELEVLNIGAAKRAELILVLLGVKKATDVAVYAWNDPPEKVRNTLAGSKLCITEVKRGGANKNLLAEYATALTQETADRLAITDPSSDHEEFGELMSYPQSAVDAFVDSTTLARERYPDMEGIIFKFSLSQDHWQEEVELMKYWSQLVKNYSPKTYAELVGN